METIQWMGFEWILKETWGQIHPNKPLFWYDPSAVNIDSQGFLHLRTHHNPKTFTINGKVITSPIGAGLVCCLHPFHFGHYKIVAKFPAGRHLFPAIWLYDLNTWPPEIDIVEGYSNCLGNYLNFNPFRMLSWMYVWSAFHYRDASGTHIKVGNRPNSISLRDPSGNFMTYEMNWDPNKISLFLDGRLTREFSGSLMQHFQQPMRFIMNNGHRSNKPVNEKQKTDFVIKSFSYQPAARRIQT